MRKRSNSMAENETRCSSFLYDKLLLSAAVNFFISQFIRNDANTILGCVRSGRFGQLRIGRHQNIHTLLGHAYVRHIFCHQHRCAAEFTHCHDESFISIDFREFEHRTILCPTSSQAIQAVQLVQRQMVQRYSAHSRETKIHELVIYASVTG